MQIRHVRVGEGEVYLATAATDGKVLLWTAPLAVPVMSPLPQADLPGHSQPTTAEGNATALEPAQLTPVSSQTAHQSSIKTLALTHSADGKHILLATGGDDNAIAVTIYSASDLVHAPQTFRVKNAHAAAVTGMAFVPTSSSSPQATYRNTESGAHMTTQRFALVTSSNDQRVKKWTVALQPRGSRAPNQEIPVDVVIDIKNTSDVFTALADVGDLTLLAPTKQASPSTHQATMQAQSRTRVLVVGNGMEVWDVSD
jgi:WD40 repeat protein